jgi:hypothetical protein
MPPITIGFKRTSSAGSRPTWRFFLFVALCTGAVVAWRAAITYPTAIFDLYPVYYGARAWLTTGNAYALDAVAPIADHPYSLFYVGNTYPFPAILVILPLSLLTPTAAAIVWVGLLMAGMLLALRLGRLPLWWAFAMPIVDGIRIEQYTILIIMFQIIALSAWRERRPWLLAGCCALILTKPNQGLFFVIALVLLARNWRQQIAVNAFFWGGSLLLDPNWVFEWLPTLDRYRAITHQPILWGLALFAIPLLLFRDWPAAATVLQFLVLPFPIASTYAAGAVPLTLLQDPRSKWLVVLSYTWIFPAILLSPAWATALTILLPTVLLATVRWHEQRGVPAVHTPLPAPEGAN